MAPIVNLQTISLSLLTVDTSHSTDKSSITWRYFGKLMYSNNGKIQHITRDKLFCSVCVSDAKAKFQGHSTPKGKSASENSDESDGETQPLVLDKFGSYAIKSYSTSISTGNLSRHLREAHGISDTKPVKTAATLRSFFVPVQKAQPTSDKRNARFLLARDLAIWFSRDLQPFSAVGDPGMVEFMGKKGVIGQDEKLPSRTTVSRDGLDDVYNAMMFEVKAIIQKSGRFGALTFDLWTDGFRRRAYITYTYNFISNEMDKINITLRTKVMPDRKTGDNIRNEILDVQQFFGLQNKAIYAVTDAGANVKLACRLSGLENHLCLGHGLHNLVMNGGLKRNYRIHEVVQKATKIVSALRYRYPELEAEMDKQNKKILTDIEDAGNVLEMEERHPLLQSEGDTIDNDTEDVPGSLEDDVTIEYGGAPKPAPTLKTFTITRWHALLHMLKSLGLNRSGINIILGRIDKTDLLFTSYEWALLEEVIKFLEPFEAVVRLLSAEKKATINVALLLRSEVEECLAEKDDDSLAITQMKIGMVTQLNHRFPINDLVIVSALLDPRFMNLKYIKSALGDRSRADFLAVYVKKHIKERDLHPADPEFATQPSELEHTSDATSSTDSTILALAIKHSEIEDSASSAIDQECAAYVATAHASNVKEGDILHFWKTRIYQFPWLTALARKMLCIPATSTPSERVFNVARLTISARRSSIHPNNLDKTIFVHDNYDVVKN